MSHISRGDLHAYLDGALGDYPEEVAAGIREHLSACTECAGLLEEERELRQSASEILASSPVIPLDLTPFEELVSQAGQPEKPEYARTSLSSRLRPLRLVATIVISLGAGWLARDLTEPARRAESRMAADVAAPPRLDGALRVEGGTEAGRELDQVDERLEAVEPADEVFADTDEVPTGVAGGMSQRVLSTPSENESPASITESPERRQRDARSSTFEEDQDVGARLRRMEAAVDAERSIVEEPLASPSSALANVAQSRGLASALERENVGAQRSVDTSIPLLIPGLSVRDVRFASRVGGSGATVTVTQELVGGEVVELRFETVSDGIFANRDVIAETVSRDANVVSVDPLPDGWIQVSQTVPGGIATLRGPLAESELSRLLDLAVAAR